MRPVQTNATRNDFKPAYSRKLLFNIGTTYAIAMSVNSASNSKLFQLKDVINSNNILAITTEMYVSLNRFDLFASTQTNHAVCGVSVFNL